MTSKAVAQAGFILQNVTNTNQGAKSPGDLKNSFGNIMHHTVKQSETVPQKQNTVQKPAETPRKEPQESVVKKKTDTLENESKETAVDKADVGKKAEDAIKDITEKIAEEFGMTQEELAKVMEMMGMQGTDLLQPNMLASLITELSGEGDMLAVVTNENLFALLTECSQIAKEVSEQLLNQLGMTQEELNQLLESMKNQESTEASGLGMQDNSQEILNMPQEPISPKETVHKIIESNAVKPETVKGEETLMPEETAGEDMAVLKEEETSADQNELMQGNDSKKENTESILPKTTETKETVKGETPKETGINPMQTFSQQLTAKLDAAIQKAAMPMETADTERIMRQVTEYLKINVRAEVTEMQMKLNPASLGTIDLSVAYKDGALTAQFTAQNEAVKAALETQVVQLRENLNEQGVKVEAIEVTIASHEFERNLSQGNADSGENSQQSKSNHRKINLEDMDALEELDLDEAERIAVELMKDNGNTVDFTA